MQCMEFVCSDSLQTGKQTDHSEKILSDWFSLSEFSFTYFQPLYLCQMLFTLFLIHQFFSLLHLLSLWRFIWLLFAFNFSFLAFNSLCVCVHACFFVAKLFWSYICSSGGHTQCEIQVGPLWFQKPVSFYSPWHWLSCRRPLSAGWEHTCRSSWDLKQSK